MDKIKSHSQKQSLEVKKFIVDELLIGQHEQAVVNKDELLKMEQDLLDKKDE
jgi:hypothetical protein